MNGDEDETPKGLAGWMRERLGVMVGVIGLVAWFAMLWFMFGDVL